MLININNCNEYPTIEMDWDTEEDISILQNECEHDWDDPIQDHLFLSLARWHDRNFKS